VLDKAYAFSVEPSSREQGRSFADPHFLFVLDTSIGLLHDFLLTLGVELLGVVLDTTISSL